MDRCRCNRHGETQRFSRRATLRVTAGLATSALLAAGFTQKLAAAQEATPAAPPEASVGPDLTEVAPLPLTGERLATFEAYVAAKLAELHVPGAAVAVVQGGEVVFLQGFGVRELGRPAPVTADTLLRVGSVTKSFSSLLAATLVDAGRLSWETPMIDLLPTFAVADSALTPRLTVADTFCACSGMPRRDWEIIFNGRALTPELVVAGMHKLPLTAPYGERYQYSNQMVAAGGYAAAVADGGSPDELEHAYAIALRERVLNPIGMARSTLALVDVVADGDYATPHGADITGALRPMPLMEDDVWVSTVAPSGGLWSTAREMARYVQTELERGAAPDGVRVVSAENLERTWRPGVAFPPPLATHYGLGWAVAAYGGLREVFHGGATLGFHALVVFLPEAELGVAVLTNGTVTATGSFTNAATGRLLELLFDQPAAIDAAQAPGLAAAAQERAELLAQLGQLDSATVTPYLGRYANPDLGEAALALREGKLVLDVGEHRSELRPHVGADGAVIAYLPVDPPLASFPPELPLVLEQDANGRPQLTLTIKDDDGKDLLYAFEPVGAAATPTP